ncbi:OLC1v1026132C1 [Oldenlandia corymbosa var. corymbosa]|uniref:OLC1v1026132C1 n=1 Tax=Oldenlandia corymbosa var. corymbosa TaxID=529605 RepID=A0AAV1C758_OLDCO|nr:OLC1v1026132C1 [Oldenlandia corymbosa var. corymbosa]
MAKPIIIARAKNNGNSVFSPLSLHIALGMIAAGSEGSTQDRLLSFLKLKSMDELHSRCSMFVTSLYLPTAVFPAARWYHRLMEFGLMVLQSLILVTRMSLPFFIKLTPMKLISVTSNKDQHISAFSSDFKVLRLPYKHGDDMNRRFFMSLYLPNAKNGLPDFVKKLCSEPGFAKSFLPVEEVEVDQFLIPKFNISYGFETSKIQRDSGTVFPSTGGVNIFQKSYIAICEQGSEAESFIDVNKDGKEAVAGTLDSSVTWSKNRKTKKRINFVADHPFFFLITEDKSGAALFMGSVVKLDPVASQPCCTL